jgi:hypothetical protein
VTVSNVTHPDSTGKREAAFYPQHPPDPTLSTVSRSMDTFRILIPASGTSSLAVNLDVVTLDIPYLLGKSTIAENRFTIDIHEKNVITALGDIPLVDDGHLMIQWNRRFLTYYKPPETCEKYIDFSCTRLHPNYPKFSNVQTQTNHPRKGN